MEDPCSWEVPGELFAELDDLSNKYGQGDLRATTRQARMDARAVHAPLLAAVNH